VPRPIEAKAVPSVPCGFEPNTSLNSEFRRIFWKECSLTTDHPDVPRLDRTEQRRKYFLDDPAAGREHQSHCWFYVGVALDKRVRNGG
jgi:hypothetical protein